MRRSLHTLVTVLLGLSGEVMGQEPYQRVITLDGTTWPFDLADKAARTDDGGLDWYNGDDLVHLDDHGIVQWATSIPRVQQGLELHPAALLETGSGIFVCGGLYDGGNASWLAHFSHQGELLWARRTPLYLQRPQLLPIPNGVRMQGFTTSGTIHIDVDDEGGALGARSLGRILERSVRMADGGYLFIGTEDLDLIAVRADPMGGMVWARRFSIDASFGAEDLVSLADGGVVICGRHGADMDAPFALALDPTGAGSWHRLYSPAVTTAAFSHVHVEPSGGLVFSGDNSLSVLVHCGNDGSPVQAVRSALPLGSPLAVFMCAAVATTDQGVQQVSTLDPDNQLLACYFPWDALPCHLAELDVTSTSATIPPVQDIAVPEVTPLDPALEELTLISSDDGHAQNDLCLLIGVQDHLAPDPALLFPDPVRDRLHLTNGSKRAEVSIFDAMGARVQVPLSVDGEELDVTGLPPGVYVLRIGKRCARFMKE